MRIVLFLTLVLAVFLIQACGVKKAPVAPAPEQLPAVTDLRVTRGPQGVWLSWSMPGSPPMDPSKLTGFHIYRFKTEAVGADCGDCPVFFERLAEIPADIRLDAGTDTPVFVYEDQPEKGFYYIYKVNPVDREGREGLDSNAAGVLF
ncbi:MAG: hypothetical protein JRI76_07280 [Deltaproteobacteria bacterium]|nr:hypothetical protein [Deltaproteobacteria bacterium]MBW2041822.1 hypothetical protein [Deltaproteobacteria bacterium]MBW2133390.1 hypothetical protein [Deltaproteobacteria bacterium]